MKHRDLVEICAIIASRLPPEQFYAQNASDIVGYRLEAERVLRAVFEAIKDPTYAMMKAADEAGCLVPSSVISAAIGASALNPEN